MKHQRMSLAGKIHGMYCDNRAWDFFMLIVYLISSIF